MAYILKTCLSLYNKNNEIVVKLNHNILAKEIKKQVLKKFTHRIDTYLIENNIITTKLYKAQTLSDENIAIQTINKKEVEKLR